jgi:outer membrane protein
MKIKLTIILFTVFGLATYAQAKKWTLQECVNYALENNITIKQTELDLQTAEINKNDAIGNFLPNLSGRASHSWNIGLNQNITTGLLENLTTQFSSVGINGGIDIYNGLQNINRLHRSNLAILASQYQLDNIKDDISLLVANSFLQVLFSKEQLKVLAVQNIVSNEELKRTEELVEAGVLPRGDLLEIQATLATQEQQIVNAENSIALAKINLAQILLIDDYQNFDIADISYDVPLTNILDESPETIIAKAKETRKDIQIAETNAEISERDLKISRGALQPSLSGFYSYSTRASYSDIIVGSVLNASNPTRVIGTVEGTGQNVIVPNFDPIIERPNATFDQFSVNDGHNFGLQLSVPVFNGFALRNNVKRSKVNLERSKIQLEQANLDLESNVYQAFNDTKGAQKAYEASIKTVTARKEAFTYSQERYNVGLLNAFDFNQSRTQLETAESDLIRAKYDYIFKLKVLEYYFGIPIANLN